MNRLHPTELHVVRRELIEAQNRSLEAFIAYQEAIDSLNASMRIAFYRGVDVHSLANILHIKPKHVAKIVGANWSEAPEGTL